MCLFSYRNDILYLHLVPPLVNTDVTHANIYSTLILNRMCHRTPWETWIHHTFLYYHVQIVFGCTKLFIRLQCSPPCCLYCSKKKKKGNTSVSESGGTLANIITYVFHKKAGRDAETHTPTLSNVTWRRQQSEWKRAPLRIINRLKVNKIFIYFFKPRHLKLVWQEENGTHRPLSPHGRIPCVYVCVRVCSVQVFRLTEYVGCGNRVYELYVGLCVCKYV